MDHSTVLHDPLFNWGRTWFRWRSLSPVPFFVLMTLLRPEFEWSHAGWLVPVAIILLAECLRLWAVGYAGGRTRTRGDTVPELIHSGPYRYCRNPIYLGNILLYSFSALLFGFIQLALILTVYSCIQYIFIVHYEETLLKQTFGAFYLDYQMSVPKWIPSFRAYPKGIQTFKWRKALRSERSTFMTMAALLIIYLLKQRWLQ